MARARKLRYHSASSTLHRGHPFGRADIQRFPLSLRKVENLLFERVIDVCCENRAHVVESL